MRRVVCVFLAVLVVFLPALPVLAQGQGQEESSLFDAWWARVFCLYLLIPVAAFVRRLFAGWLNFLGLDEERWAGLGMGMLGGIAGLGMAAASAFAAGSRGAGWLLGTVFGGRGPDWFRQGPPGGPGGGGAGSGPGGPAGQGGAPKPAGGGTGAAGGGPAGAGGGPAGAGGGPVGAGGGPAGTGGGPAGADAGGSVLPSDDVKGEGLPVKGSGYEADPERARRQAVQDWLQQARLYRESVAERRRWLATGASVLAEAGRAAGMALGTLAAVGLGGAGTSWGKEIVHAFGQIGAAPGRLAEIALQAPPPRYPRALLDGARWR